MHKANGDPITWSIFVAQVLLLRRPSWNTRAGMRTLHHHSLSQRSGCPDGRTPLRPRTHYVCSPPQIPTRFSSSESAAFRFTFSHASKLLQAVMYKPCHLRRVRISLSRPATWRSSDAASVHDILRTEQKRLYLFRDKR